MGFEVHRRGFLASPDIMRVPGLSQLHVFSSKHDLFWRLLGMSLVAPGLVQLHISPNRKPAHVLEEEVL